MKQRLLILAMGHLVKRHGKVLATRVGRSALARFNTMAIKRGLTTRTFTLEEVMAELKEQHRQGAFHPREWAGIAEKLKDIRATMKQGNTSR